MNINLWALGIYVSVCMYVCPYINWTWGHVSAMCQLAICTRFIPSSTAARNNRQLEARASRTCGPYPSCHRLTGRQVAVMATCRDLSKLALRHAPAECLHTHSSPVRRHQTDVRDGSEGSVWPRAPTIRETGWEEMFFFHEIRQQRGAVSCPPEPRVQCVISFAYLTGYMYEVQYIHYPLLQEDLNIPSGETEALHSSPLQARLMRPVVQEIDDPSNRFHAYTVFLAPAWW